MAGELAELGLEPGDRPVCLQGSLWCAHTSGTQFLLLLLRHIPAFLLRWCARDSPWYPGIVLAYGCSFMRGLWNGTSFRGAY